MASDPLLQKLLRTFFREFLELFLPDVAKELDFGSLTFPNPEGAETPAEHPGREPDVVARLRSRAGDPEAVFVFVASERADPECGSRMFEHFSDLKLRHRIPVLPVALFLQEGIREGIGRGEFRLDFEGLGGLQFRYETVTLPSLEAADYVEKGPLGAALSALMRKGRDQDPLELRLHALLGIGAAGLEEESQDLLVSFVQRYSPVPESVRSEWKRLISREEYRGLAPPSLLDNSLD